ncbi:hypothetical protein LJR225_002044 [Phenylobacterium sp. LjRoot225]|uniref:hypothetical protein n=1 Tax=Phenylobacterium sp. LjRoot225 TaxID=3342285 RepID=UPI003ED1652E
MMVYDEPVRLDFVRGDASGLDIPAHDAALRAAGETFLTDAFRAFGSLSADNRVVRITGCESFPGGNSGHKLFLSVEYERPEPGLHSDLFVKFSRDFADAFRDRRRYELEAEVRLAALSRHPGFPIEVPAAYFADFHRDSGTGLLITQRVAFGRDGIEPLRPKCMDHELAEPLAYYRATVTALARLAAAHQSGRLSPQVETLFPFDADAAAAENPIPWTEAQLRERVAAYAAFAERCPQLLPARIATPQFIAQLEAEAVRLLRHQATIRRFLHADRDFIALCHWNTNIDNAWFWRLPSGGLQCGLLDWGMVRQMNVACALWGGLCGAGPDIVDGRLEELLPLFAATLHEQGGPRLEAAELRLHLDLSVAMLGLSMMMDVPALVLSRLPEAADAEGPLDPVLFKDEVARGFLHVFTAFLSLWQAHGFGASLDAVLRRSPAA